MIRNKEITRAVRRALVMSAVVAGAYSTASYAQQAPQTQSNQPEIGAQEATTTVTVTGSRIPQPQIEAVSPVTSVGSQVIQQTGTTRVEDLLNSLPQVAPDLGSAESNGATGTATVSLRGLGANRTLVLINGRRLMPGDPTQNGMAAPDLNQIPAALVERVDVLTGGASAVYGADAVAGVVNFMMNDHFQGVQVDGNYSFYQHGNSAKGIESLLTSNGFAVPPGDVTAGFTRDFDVIAGSNFADGRGNATVYFGYRRQAAVLQGKYDHSACALTGSGTTVTCGGSSTSYPGRFNVGTGNREIGPGNALVPFQTLYNFAPLNYYQRPDERYTAGAFAHYDINEHARVYTEFMFMDDRSIAQIAPSGAFYGSGLGTTLGIPDASNLVNCDNPYLSSSEFTTWCTSYTYTKPNGTTATYAGPDANNNAHVLIGRRNVEGGPRYDDLGHTSFRAVVGVKGSIDNAWSYDVYFQNGITRLSEEYFNDVSRSRLAYALQAVADPTTGSIVCKANANGANGAPGCVPYNIYQLGGVTPAAVNYISVPGISKGATTERVFDASVTGDLGEYGIKLPTAHEGLQINAGTEYREEQSELYPDLEFITNDLAGQGAPTLPTVGSFHVWEGFTELRMALLQDMPLAKSLTVDAGYRYSDYSLAFGSTNTYKFGLQWAPISDVRLRLGYNRAVRAPNIQELFLQDRVQLDGVTDPCSGSSPSYTAAQCALTGVTPGEYGNIAPSTASQYNGLVGGNPNLQPEKADTYTVGLVFTPTVLPDFNATIDYYNIKITNYITQYGPDFILATCLNTGSPLYCNKIHRVPASAGAAAGSLWIGDQGYVEDQFFNLGSQMNTGIDVTASYRLDTGFLGRFAFDFVGNYTIINQTEPVPGLGSYDCVGYYGATCGVPIPHWKHQLRTTWNTPIPALDAWLTWRYIGGVDNENFNPSPLLATGYFANPGQHLPHVHYIDIGASYTLASKYTLRVGVNNLFDRDPPLAALGYLPAVYGNGNTFPQAYDAQGRYLFMSLTLNF